MLSTILSSIDIFGIPVSLNFSGKEKSKSPFGGTVSVLFSVFVVWAIYNGVKDLLSTTDPKTVSSETCTEDPTEMIISPSNFPLAIRLLAPQSLEYKPFLDEQIFTVTVVQDSLHRTKLENGTVSEHWTSKEIAVEPCQPKHFGDMYNIFSSLDMETLVCISQDSVSIQGAFVSPVYEIFTVYISECVDSSGDGSCASSDKRKQYLEGAYFNIIFANMVLDPSNYAHPDSRYQDVYLSILSLASMRSITIEMSHLDVYTDSGWLTESISRQTFAKVEKASELTIGRNASDTESSLIACAFQMSKLQSSYTRSYKKIQTVLAEVAGLANTCLIAFLVVTSGFLKLKVRETLMNELFEIRDEDRQYKRKKKNTNKQQQQKQQPSPSQSKEIDSEYRTSRENNTDKKLKIELPKRDLMRSFSASMSGARAATRVDSRIEKEGEIMLRTPKTANTIVRNIRLRKSEEFERRPFPSIKLSSWEDLGSDNRDNQRSVTSFEDEVKVRSSVKFPSIKEQGVKIEVKILEEPEVENNEEQSIMFTEQNGEEQRPSQAKLKEDDKRTMCVINDDNEEDIEKKEGNKQSGGRENAGSSGEEVGLDLERKSQGVTLSFGEYLLSFVYRPEYLKKKMRILEEGINNVNLRLDIVNMLKKMRDVDRIRALLLDSDQEILFVNLPKQELRVREERVKLKQNTLSQRIWRRGKFRRESLVEKEVWKSYERIKQKGERTEVDEKLLEIYNDRLQ